MTQLSELPTTRAQPKEFMDSPATAAWIDELEARLSQTSLTTDERQALVEFLLALHTYAGDAVAQVILYGSAARGEPRFESDMDLLVLTKAELTNAEQQAIRNLGSQPGYDHNCVLSVLVMTPQEQAWHGRGSSLWRNIQKDGIAVWPTPSAPLRLDAGFFYRKISAPGEYMMTEAQYEEIRIHMEQSTEELETAQILMEAGKERKAISSCYYAIFHATTALLLTKGVIRARHGGTRAALGEYFIRTGILPKELSDLYTLLQGEREMADYQLNADPPWEDVIEQRMVQAKEFVATIRLYLIQNGYLHQ
jgi:uncharacterized protein (UPF0332 family)